MTELQIDLLKTHRAHLTKLIDNGKESAKTASEGAKHFIELNAIITQEMISIIDILLIETNDEIKVFP